MEADLRAMLDATAARADGYGREEARKVREVIENITNDLKYTMAMTASPDITHIDRSIVRQANFHW